MGSGHEHDRLVKRVRDEGLDQVHFLPPIPKAQVPTFLAGVDIAYIGWQRVPIYRFGIAPNKLMDYMMARCVVLHSVEAGNDPVAEAGCGLTVEPESPAAVAQGLRQLAALPRAEFEKDRPAFFRSIKGTLNHILVGDRIWLAFLTGPEHGMERLDRILHDDLPGLRAALEAGDRRRAAGARPQFAELVIAGRLDLVAGA